MRFKCLKYKMKYFILKIMKIKILLFSDDVTTKLPELDSHYEWVRNSNTDNLVSLLRTHKPMCIVSINRDGGKSGSGGWYDISNLPYRYRYRWIAFNTIADINPQGVKFCCVNVMFDPFINRNAAKGARNFPMNNNKDPLFSVITTTYKSEDKILRPWESLLSQTYRNWEWILWDDSGYGKDMIGESSTLDISDIDLQTITKYVDNKYESKKLCFLRDHITDINYTIGAHTANPQGNVKYSSKIYINKHMNMLGADYLIDKILKRYKRSEFMRSKGRTYHYIDDKEKIMNNYSAALTNCKYLSNR